MAILTRRAFLISGGLLGGGLALGYVLCPDRLGVRGSVDGEFALLTWLRIRPDNTVTVLVPHVEMGQGSQTALAMMLADELDVEWDQVRVEQAPAESMFATGDVVRVFMLGGREVAPGIARRLDMATYQVAALMNLQLTGGSLSIRSTGRLGMRRAGAAAREMLIRAAAAQWSVPVAECAARAGQVSHAGSSRALSYGALAESAAKLRPHLAPPMKSRGEYRLCGQSRPLIHSAPAVRGSIEYGVDAVLPGMKYAAIRHVPFFGGAVESFDAGSVTGQQGVRDISQLPGAVAVVADSWWQAQRALDSMMIRFRQPEAPVPDSAALSAEFDRLLAEGAATTDRELGEISDTSAGSKSPYEATYEVPFLAHATLEPMNCTAWLHDGKLELWTSTQDPLGTRAVAAKAADLAPASVTVHAAHLGGGFGRRTPGAFNYVEDAVRIARRVSYPVKLIWSREEDIQHDFFRPAGKARLQAALGADGYPQFWRHLYTDIGVNDDHAAAFIPYAIANQYVGRVVQHKVGVPVGFWRSVEHSHQGFYLESFVDELAHAARADPLAYRMRLLQKAPRFQRALQRAADMIRWEDGHRNGIGKGIAIKESFGTIVAEATEVDVSSAGAVRVLRVCAAVDAGEIVHPDNARAQLEGGILFGLGAAMSGRVTLSGGRVEQGNFDDYPVLMMADVPEIDVAFLDSDAPMGGIGEVGVPPVAAAVCNAVFAACGVRIRRLPINGQARIS